VRQQFARSRFQLVDPLGVVLKMNAHVRQVLVSRCTAPLATPQPRTPRRGG
jgi:hypothetical protein